MFRETNFSNAIKFLLSAGSDRFTKICVELFKFELEQPNTPLECSTDDAINIKMITLEYLINVQQTLLFFGKSSYLHGLITSYTFINFRKIFLPTRLLHPTRLLAFSKSILWSSNFGSKSQENRKIPTVLWVWMSYLWLKHKIVQ